MGNSNPSVQNFSNTAPKPKLGKLNPTPLQIKEEPREVYEPIQGVQNQPFYLQAPNQNKNKEIFVCQKVVDFNHDFLARFRLAHPNLLRTLGFDLQTNYFQTNNYVMGEHLYFEYAPKSIKVLLEGRKPNQLLSDADMRVFLRDMVNVLSFLQENEVSHGDIDTSTIFFDEIQESFKIYDQELLAGTNSGFVLTKQQVKLSLLAPELLMAFYYQPNLMFLEGKYVKADVFSLGMVFLEVGSLRDSLDLYDYQQLKINLQEINQRLALMSQYFSREVVKIIALMLDFDCNKRPDFLHLRKILAQEQIIDISQEIQNFYVTNNNNNSDELEKRIHLIDSMERQNDMAQRNIIQPQMQKQIKRHNSLHQESNPSHYYQQQIYSKRNEGNNDENNNFNQQHQWKQNIVYVNPNDLETKNLYQQQQQFYHEQPPIINQKEQYQQNQIYNPPMQENKSHRNQEYNMNQINQSQQEKVIYYINKTNESNFNVGNEYQGMPNTSNINANALYENVSSNQYQPTLKEYESQDGKPVESLQYGELRRIDRNRKIQELLQQTVNDQTNYTQNNQAYNVYQQKSMQPNNDNNTHQKTLTRQISAQYMLSPQNVRKINEKQENVMFSPQLAQNMFPSQNFKQKLPAQSMQHIPQKAEQKIERKQILKENAEMEVKFEDKETKESLERLRMEILNSKKIIENYEKHKKEGENNQRRPFNEMGIFGNMNIIQKQNNFKGEKVKENINSKTNLATLKHAHNSIIERNKKLDERLEEVLKKSQAITKGLKE